MKLHMMFSPSKVTSAWRKQSDKQNEKYKQLQRGKISPCVAPVLI